MILPAIYGIIKTVSFIIYQTFGSEYFHNIIVLAPLEKINRLNYLGSAENHRSA
jgi:hypothetical protein